MAQALNIVVTCTGRKTQAPAEELQAALLSSRSVTGRAKEWCRRLEKAFGRGAPGDSQTLAASELYCGEHWQTVLSLGRTAKVGRPQVRIWICSAGYGLIQCEDRIVPYSATFTAGRSDFVVPDVDPCQRGEALREWWRHLGEWSGPSGPEAEVPRTLHAVAKAYPADPLLVCVSSQYLVALEEDLKGAAAELQKPELLSILSAGTSCARELDAHRLPCNARLQTLLGGTRTVLNARILRELMKRHQGQFTHDRLRTTVDQLMEDAPEPEVLVRPPATDEEVVSFIRQQVARGEALRHTPLLRKFRHEEKRACEHFRFKGLVEQVKRQMAGKGGKV